jgi:ABC-type uncharacterized transport system permease subunit
MKTVFILGTLFDFASGLTYDLFYPQSDHIISGTALSFTSLAIVYFIAACCYWSREK